tara:strand:- start:209 stop:559 length:351 start_codon:yes stop_codon:yes gene_type:complete
MEIVLENDLDQFEKFICDSPTKDLNEPRLAWNSGNVLHGLMKLLDENNQDAPPLMSCEEEHWLYLLYMSKISGIDLNHKNSDNLTPSEYLQTVCKHNDLYELSKDILESDVIVNYE